MKRMIHGFTAVFAVSGMILLILCGAASYFTPAQLTVSSLNGDLICGNFPLSVKYKENTAVYTAVDTLQPDIREDMTADIMLFGSIPVKEVNVRLSERKNVILGGTPFGIRIYTDGLVVSGTSGVVTSEGEKNPADEAGIECGDIIISVNGKKLDTNEQLLDEVEKSNGKAIKIQGRHNEKEYQTEIVPVLDTALKKYRIGLMVRDSCAGIGTMTFTDPETGCFAGLGHGICDTQSGSLMPLESGDIVSADITSVRKSVCGSPGSLSGFFSNDKPVGTITANSEQGVYGTVREIDKNQTTIPVAYKQEVVRGKAQIITTVDENGAKWYDVEIEDISYNNVNTTKNMVIRVTDKELLSKTGGIVQGMSGSPIVQNGKLVGAVTHVFVNEPNKGYALFSENMLAFTDTIIQNTVKKPA